jgi:tetratricopeptide (TPR) repeat protein
MFLEGFSMSQFRLARISLILAATLGLNAMPAAHAQDKAAAPAAAVPKADTIRPDMFKLLDPAKIKELMVAKKYADVQANITAAEAFADRTPYEEYIINRMKLALGSSTSNDKMAMTALEAVINSGRADKSDHVDFIQALANYYYNAKDYTKALEWFKRYQAEAPDGSKVRRPMSRAYFLNNDFASSKQELDKLVADAEAAGTAPTMDDLRLQASAAAKLKDMNAYTTALEKLVALYPSDDFWTDMLRRMQSKPTFSNRLQLDVYRLEMVALKEMAPEEYTEMTELALLGGYFTEAKQAMDAGFAKGVLGKGSNAAKHKQLHDKATKGAADDAKTIAAGEAAAQAAKTGLPLVNLGYAYVTMDQFDKGIPMMEKGIAKGGLKNADDAKLHLAVAYAKAGRKPEAIKTLEGLKGNDGMTDLAKYWTMFLKGPVATATAAVPATVK